MKAVRVGFPALAVSFALCGCAFFHHKKRPDPLPASPRLIGSVAYVNEALGFVLVDADSFYTPQAGQALKVFREGKEVGILAVTPERKRPFVSADIVKGEPRTGDDVYE